MDQITTLHQKRATNSIQNTALLHQSSNCHRMDLNVVANSALLTMPPPFKKSMLLPNACFSYPIAATSTWFCHASNSHECDKKGLL